MADRGDRLSTVLHALVARAAGSWTMEACGVTRMQTPIPALVHRDAYRPQTSCFRVLLLGGLSAQWNDVHLVLQALEAYLAGDRSSPAVVDYFERLDVALPGQAHAIDEC